MKGRTHQEGRVEVKFSKEAREETMALLRHYWQVEELTVREQMRARIIALNLPLVHFVVNKLLDKLPPRRRAEYDDLVQEGSFGLAIAVESFDPWRRVGFATYAYDWINRYVRRESYAGQSAIGSPGHVMSQNARLRRAGSWL